MHDEFEVRDMAARGKISIGIREAQSNLHDSDHAFVGFARRRDKGVPPSSNERMKGSRLSFLANRMTGVLGRSRVCRYMRYMDSCP